MELKKGISFFGVFSIATGAMISSGIFILPGLAFSKAGPAVFISYFLAGILGLFGILSVIELATAMPKAGGDYYYINKAFGSMFGTVSGFLGWFALSLKSAFAIFGISEILFLYTKISPRISGLVLCLFFVLINIKGVKEAAIFQVIMVAGLLSLMLIYVVMGIPNIDKTHYTPFLTVGIDQILITSGFIFISFGGLLKVANVSEEVINPKRNIPLGILSSVIVVTIFYTLITFVITGTLDAESFKKSLTPVADSAKVIMGNPGYIIILIASLLAFFTTANAGIMSASRYPMALSMDQLLPRQFGAVSKKNKTPTLAIFITGAIIYLALLFPLEILVKAASTVILTSYILTNIAVIILRESKISNYKPSFKAPLYPVLQILCVFLFTYFIIVLGKDAIEVSAAFILISFFIYIFYGRKIKKRESALLHLLKRITDDQLTDNLLEDELREVLINRDHIEQDHFDELLKSAYFFDIKGPCEFKNLLPRVADKIADVVNMEKYEIISRFIERQTQSNTAVSDFLAIPHIIIDGEDKMFLTIVRCKEGVRFTDKEDKVKAVFLLGGTKEQRTLHLKAIASIATLVEKKNFSETWEKTRTVIELKNLMIMSGRKRFK